MPPWGPISRRKLVRALRECGYNGPFSGSRHQFMVRGDLVLTIPNPHRGDIGVGLLGKILAQAGISKEEWQGL